MSNRNKKIKKLIVDSRRLKVVNPGFTLIELIVAFGLSVTIGVMAFAGYGQFTNSQKLNSTTLDVSTILQDARSRAQTQVKPDSIAACIGAPLDGYEVRFCTFPGSQCFQNGRYEMHIVCGGTRSLVSAKQLPADISFANGTSGTFFFRVLTGSVQAGTIRVSGYNKTKTIQVTGTGSISVQ